MALLIVLVVTAIIILTVMQKWHSKSMVLSQSNMENPKFREMVEESLLKREVKISACL
jgi:hypothetical protein